MKKILLTALLVPVTAFAQSFPSPTFNSLTLQNPLTTANGGTGTNTSTGSGSAVLSNSPTLVAPALGTPSAVTLTNGTGLPVSTGVSGLGTGVAAALANAVTGSGSPVLATSPTLASPTITGTMTVPTATTGVNTTSAASTAYVANEQPCANMIDHGGDPTGTNDNSAALTATLAANPTGQSCAYFGPGTWKFTSQQIINLTAANNSVTLRGAGAEVSVLSFPNASGGVKINYALMTNSAHIRDLTFATGQVGASTALSLINSNQIANQNYQVVAPNDVTNVAFRGSDGYGQFDYWLNAVAIQTVSNVGFNGIAVTGTGTGTTGTGLSISGYNVSGATNAATSSSSNVLHFASTPAGLTNGMFVFDLTNPSALLQADQTSVSSFTGTTVTLNQNAQGAGVVSGDTIAFMNAGIIYNVAGSNFNNLQYGIQYLMGTQGIAVTASNFTGGQYGIYAPANQVGLVELAVTGGNQFNVTHNQISLLSPVSDAIITGNLIYVNDNTGTYPGINLGSVSRFVVSSNDFVDTHSGGTAPTAISVGNTNSLGGNINGNSFNGFLNGVSLLSTSASVLVGPQQFLGTTNPYVNAGTNNIYGTPGVTSGAAAPGNAVGAFTTASASSVSIPAATATNLTSITLSPGSYLCEATYMVGTTQTSPVTVQVGLNTTSGTLPGDLYRGINIGSYTITSGSTIKSSLKPFTVSTSTTVYEVVYAQTADTSASGLIECLRNY